MLHQTPAALIICKIALIAVPSRHSVPEPSVFSVHFRQLAAQAETKRLFTNQMHTVTIQPLVIVYISQFLEQAVRQVSLPNR